MKHRLFHRNVRVIGCATCQAEVDAIWQARADRGWVTDPSDPGWSENDAEYAAAVKGINLKDATE